MKTKLNSKLYDISLQAGGAHYPVINPELQINFARILIQQCIDEAHRRGRSIVNTYGTTIHRSVCTRPPSSEKKSVPVAQLSTRSTSMPPIPIGTPPRRPPRDRPRASSILLRSPADQRIAALSASGELASS